MRDSIWASIGAGAKERVAAALAHGDKPDPDDLEWAYRADTLEVLDEIRVGQTDTKHAVDNLHACLDSRLPKERNGNNRRISPRQGVAGGTIGSAILAVIGWFISQGGL